MSVFSLQILRPMSPETLVMFVDTSGCGFSLVSVSGTEDPLAVIDVAETLAMVAGEAPDIAGFVIASVRPGGGLLLDDDEIWFEIDLVVEEFGLILYDWLVIGIHGTLSVPREFGLPTRWPMGAPDAATRGQ